MSGFGDSLTTVGTVQLHPLGTIVVEPATQGGTRADQGEKTWIYVHNTAAAPVAWAQGEIIMRTSGATTYQGDRTPIAAQASSRIIGVAQHAVAAGSYGFILRKGLGEVLADTGGLTVDVGIIDGNAVAGRADVAAAITNATFGFSTETVLATALATCWLDCQG
jgi:hypothetical protein